MMKTKLPDTLDSAVIQHFLQQRFEGVLDELAVSTFKLPLRATKARVCAFHGFSGHSRQADIKYLGNSLRGSWYFFQALDLPFHGQSVAPDEEETRGRLPSILPWARAVHAMTYKALSLKTKKPIPLYLMGYSAGAIALLTFLQMFPLVQKYIAGVILVAPAFEVDQNAREWLLAHPRLAQVIDFCEHRNGTAIVLDCALDLVSRFYPDVFISKLEDVDPSDHLEYKKELHLRTASVLHLAAKRTRRKMSKITVPLLIIHGAQDPVANVRATIQASADAGTAEEEKQLIIYEDADHHIVHRAVPDILEWLNREHARASYEKIVYAEGLLKDTVKISSVFYFLSKTILGAFTHACAQLLFIFRDMFARWITKIMFWK
jgi:alpha-beta hydrolase superfamily lysophospholipase